MKLTNLRLFSAIMVGNKDGLNNLNNTNYDLELDPNYKYVIITCKNTGTQVYTNYVNVMSFILDHDNIYNNNKNIDNNNSPVKVQTTTVNTTNSNINKTRNKKG